MAKRLYGGCSPTKEAHYKAHEPIAERHKVNRMKRIIKGFKDSDNYEIKDGKIRKKK